MYLGVESLCRLLTANKVPFDLPTECKSKVYVLKLVSFESFSPVAEVGKLLFRSTHGLKLFLLLG